MVLRRLETFQPRELTCETLRDANGNVVGYGASFGDGTPAPDYYTLVVIREGYEGDKSYIDGSASGSPIFFARRVGPSGKSFGPDNLTGGFAYRPTLTLSEGGKRGIVEDETGNYTLPVRDLAQEIPQCR